MKLLSFDIRCAQRQRNPAVDLDRADPVGAGEAEWAADRSSRLTAALRAVAILRAQATGDIVSLALASGPDVQAALGMQMLEEFNHKADAESVNGYLEEAGRLHRATRDQSLGMNEAAMAMLRLVVGDDRSRTADLLRDVEDLLRRKLDRSETVEWAAAARADTRGRMQMNLRVVSPPARASGVLLALSQHVPAIDADGDLDALCGGCAHVVARGLTSPTDITGMVFFCARCGRCSELPVD